MGADRLTTTRPPQEPGTAMAAIPWPGDTYEDLAAWYSGFSFCEHYRKVVLSQCRETIRAGAALTSQKLTEARLDDLARQHGAYLDYLARHLQGRIQWEREFLRHGGMR